MRGVNCSGTLLNSSQCRPTALPPVFPRSMVAPLRPVAASSSSNNGGVQGSFRGTPDGCSPESLDWGSSAFPSYLVSLSGRPFPCQEGLDPSTTRPGSGIKAKWKREDAIWQQIRREAAADAAAEPLLSSFLYASILAHDSFEKSLAFVLSNRLADTTLLPTQLFEIFVDVLSLDDDMRCGALADVEAGIERDPACISMVQVILNCKGFQAIQTHRVAHSLWSRGKRVMALALQSRSSEVFAVDIHPGARIGKGILLDHGTGVVIGETAVIGDNCSMLQNVTLGGTGKETGDRHPKIGNNVLIGASATVLGNITIGNGSMIGAGSLVLKPVAPRAMVAGSPAKVVGKVAGVPAKTMEQRWDDSVKAVPPNPPAPTATVAAEAAKAQPWPAADVSNDKDSESGSSKGTESGHMQRGTSSSSSSVAGRSDSSTARESPQASSSSMDELISDVQLDPNELLAAQRDAFEQEAAQQAASSHRSGARSEGGNPGEGQAAQQAASSHTEGPGSEGSSPGKGEGDRKAAAPPRPKAPTAWGPVASIRGEGI
uniref:serine O-acetyltransferase n=1 Tax=Dunaliella tertiolecta TaxID=3047 RepID=A0A7S3R4K9_DUNTE